MFLTETDLPEHNKIGTPKIPEAEKPAREELGLAA
jgi:hypothetical protein